MSALNTKLRVKMQNPAQINILQMKILNNMVDQSTSWQ